MTSPSIPIIHSRLFRGDVDFWRIRDLAIKTYPITDLGWNWDLRRWDGWRFYNAEPGLNPDCRQTIRLWETADGLLVGAVNAGGAGLFYLQLHPNYRGIEEEMIAWAEDQLAVPVPGTNELEIFTEVYEYDAPRSHILERRGYEKTGETSVIRRMYLKNQPLPEARLPEGYTLRPIRATDLEDCQRLADLLNAAFNRTFHNAAEFYQFAQDAPCFREDLHLVAVAPDGTFGAHAAVIFDEINLRGLFEPVCTHPQHRRKSLAQNLMFEGLHRIKALGAEEVTVETGDMIPANALYEFIGFTEKHQALAWRKVTGESKD